MNRVVFAALISACFLAHPVCSHTTVSTDVLFTWRKTPLPISRFSAAGNFQLALKTAAAACGLASAADLPAHPTQFGPKTAIVLKDLSTCPGFEAFAQPTDAAVISTGFWQKVAPNLPVPSFVQRAAMLAFANEGTDYDHIEFNVGTTDPGILTWGPYGATAGQAFQVERILAKIDDLNGELLPAAFGSEIQAVRDFMKVRSEAAAKAIVTAVKASPTRRSIWAKGFSELGESQAVRDAYDQLMMASGTAGIPEALRDFYRSYWRKCWPPTEIDYAYFLDRAVQLDVRQKKTDDAINGVSDAEQRFNQTFGPAERRRAIAANFTAGAAAYVGDRLARDVIYYWEGVGAARLDDTTLLALRSPGKPVPSQLNNEDQRWRNRTGLLASNYGLSDTRLASAPSNLAGPPPCLLDQ